MYRREFLQLLLAGLAVSARPLVAATPRKVQPTLQPQSKSATRTRFNTSEPLTGEEALVYWVEYLQSLPGERENMCMLMATMDDDDFTEVDMLQDSPENINDATWSRFELWSN